MSIELKQAAQQAVDAFDAFGDADDFASLFALSQKMGVLRTAIQQATQPAEVTDEQIESCALEAGFSVESTGSIWAVDGLVGTRVDPGLRKFARAIRALRPVQVPMTPDEIVNARNEVQAHSIVSFAKGVRAAEAHHFGITAQAKQPDNVACKSVQKRLEAQQPATAIACGVPGMAKTTCPYCEQGFAFEYEQPVTGEPVGYMNAGNIHELKHGGVPYGYVYPRKESGVSIPVYDHPAPSGLGDSKRLDYLQDRGATIDLIPGVAAFYPMRFRVGGLHSSANIDVRAAIDAAMLAAKEEPNV